MSEQDAADSENPSEDVTPRADAVEDIAEEPEGDPDEALSEIIGDAGGEERTDDEDSTVPDPGDLDVEEELLDRVRETSPETTARGIALLRQRVAALEGQVESRAEEIDDLESRLARKQADFENYKKRQKERMAEEKQRATEDLVERLLDVRDNLERALEQGEDAEIRGGVETTLKQFDEQLQRENVERIDPEVGGDVDPQRHEALATIASAQPEGAIAEVHRPGYEMGGKVIRAAQVAVSDASQRGTEDEDEA
ncbi:MAG: nucleotide exchange factor GrpE [Haloarculaceae archaeon]